MSTRRTFPNPRNGCANCGQDFTSLQYFDQHRVGTYDYTLSEGLRQEPPREDGRRCLDADELRELGLELDTNGRWTNPTLSAQVRQRFANAPSRSGVGQISAIDAQDDPVPHPGEKTPNMATAETR